MTMAERQEKGSMRIPEMGHRLKRKSAVQSFRHFLMMIKKRLKLCTAHGKHVRELFCGRTRPCEMARFYAFVKEQESITFPEKPLDPGGRPATEKEEGVRYKQMHMKSAFDDGSQRINPEAEICVSPDDIDTGKITVVGIFKHGTPP